MTPELLEQELKQKKINSMYLLYGKEEFLLNTCVKKIKKLFGEILPGINYVEIDETNINNLISEIQTPAFGFSKKLIIVKNSGLFKKKKISTKKKEVKNKKEENSLENSISKFINENISIIKDAVVVIFIEPEIEKNNLFNIIEKYGVVCNFEELNPGQIAARLKAICKAYKVNIDNKTMQVFIETCGTNMQVLINEIRKLIEYAGENGTITTESINKLSIKEMDAVIFDLTDSLGKKDIKNALDIIHELLYNKEPIQKILITLYNHFRRLYITSLAIEGNKDIASSLNLKPNQMFLVNKYKMQVKYFDKQTLLNILNKLIDLDYNNKQGNIDINVGLEAILCTYCGK